MASYKIKTNQNITVNGVPIKKGLTVELNKINTTPFDAIEIILEAYKNKHGIDFKSSGINTTGYFQYEKI